MVWQDIVITIIMVAFSYALLPQVFQGFKEKKGLINLQTSGITCLGLYVLSFVYFTLDLYFSSTIVLISGMFWTILFFQKIAYN